MLGYALYLSGSFDIPDKDEKGGWIYEYQSLIGVVIAALGTLFAWYKYTADISRKLKSNRAKMPDALAELNEFCTNCFFSVLDSSEYNPLSDAPFEAISVFKNAIEYEQGQNFDAIYELINFYQIHNSRLKPYLNDKDRSRQKLQLLYDSIKLNMYINRFYSYARGESDYLAVGKGSYQEMMDAFKQIKNKKISKNCTIDDLQMGAIQQYIKAKHPE